MGSNLRPQRIWLAVLLAGAALMGGFVTFAAISPKAAATPLVAPVEAPAQQLPPEETPLSVVTQSGVVDQGECFVTHQKNREGPIMVQPVTGAEAQEALLREVEIIKVISSCAQRVEATTLVESQLETFIVTCDKKEEDFSGVQCATESSESNNGSQ